MQSVVKGMVQVAGTTYRIVRLTPGHYNVVRILDDTCVGGRASRSYLTVMVPTIDLWIAQK